MRFPVASLCFTDAKGIAFHHDFGLVGLSYIIAAVGSYASLEMIEHWRSPGGTHALAWQFASAAALGGSIWSMHFIAMLALKIPLPVTYAPEMTLISLVVAIGAAGLGLQIIRPRPSWIRICLAGTTVGLGVAAMHYIGMAALRFPGSLAYTPRLWSLSVVVGIAAAIAALWLSLTLREQWQRAVAALVMGSAICGMHYTGMASAVFQGDPLAPVAAGMPRGPIALAVALTTLALIMCALVFVVADRRLLASTRREAELLRLSNARLARANEKLEVGRQQFDAALDNMSQGLTFFDADQKLIVCNRRYREIYRLSPEQTRAGTSFSDTLDYRKSRGSLPCMPRVDYLSRHEGLSSVSEPYDLTDELPDGRTILMHYQPLPNGGWVTTHEDVTERRRAEASIVFLARHDALTRIPNRVLFHERLEQAIEMAVRGSGCAVLCLDLDRFKLVNDTLGHPVGDGLLRAASDRLQACVREVDTVARFGGDEFAILQMLVDRPDDAALLANRIVAAFGKPFEVDGHQIAVGASIGVAVARGDVTSPEQLLKNADIALYVAKSEGRGTVRFFEPEMDVRIQSRRTLELDLRAAIVRSEFELYYQPVVNLIAGTISGVEALLRWHHPMRGLVPPGDFIGLAEEMGIIVTIGEWVLRTACLEAGSWPENIRVAVNLSPVQFKQGNLLATVEAALEASGLQPDRLELEITESVLLQNTEATLTTLHQLRTMGVGIALDDFGTGYSSLSYLRSFPFSKIKIDQSFVLDIAENKEAMSIIGAMTTLGHSLQIKTTAEGVETTEQLHKLREVGCTEVQGYIFSRPMPAGEVPLLIERLSSARQAENQRHIEAAGPDRKLAGVPPGSIVRPLG